MNSEDRIDCLPVRASLKPVQAFDRYEGMTDDESAAYSDFINWYLLQDVSLLLSLPKPAKGDFIPVQLDGDGYDESAFNTCDFHRYKGNLSFDKYGYRLKKIMERVNDLAMMHSCISDVEARNNVKQRCRSFIENEFLIDALEAQKKGDNRKANRLFKYIEQCKQVWREWNPA